MDIQELEREIHALRLRPLLVVCKTSKGKESCMSLRECVETGSSFLYVAVDELDALLDRAINGTA